MRRVWKGFQGRSGGVIGAVIPVIGRLLILRRWPNGVLGKFDLFVCLDEER